MKKNKKLIISWYTKKKREKKKPFDTLAPVNTYYRVYTHFLDSTSSRVIVNSS